MAKWAKEEAHNHGFSELPHSISKSDEGEALKTLARIVGDVSQQTVLGPRRIHLAVQRPFRRSGARLQEVGFWEMMRDVGQVVIKDAIANIVHNGEFPNFLSRIARDRDSKSIIDRLFKLLLQYLPFRHFVDLRISL